MATKLEELKHEAAKLKALLADVEAKRDGIRAQMESAPLEKIKALSEDFAGHKVGAEVLAERLAKVQAAVEAEQKRLNSSEVKDAIRNGEKAEAEFLKMCDDIGQQFRDLGSNIEAAGRKGNEAAALLRQGDRDPISQNGLQFLVFIKRDLDQMRMMGRAEFPKYIKG